MGAPLKPPGEPGCIAVLPSASGVRGIGTGAGRPSPAPRWEGGQRSGPTAMDRGRPGTTRHLVTDGNGSRTATASRSPSDGRVIPGPSDAVPPIRHRRGRPRQRPAKLHADKAQDHRRGRSECHARSIRPRLAWRGVDRRERLRRHRRVAERTPAWFSRFRRLTIGYERPGDIHEAFISLGRTLVRLNQIRRFFSILLADAFAGMALAAALLLAGWSLGPPGSLWRPACAAILALLHRGGVAKPVTVTNGWLFLELAERPT